MATRKQRINQITNEHFDCLTDFIDLDGDRQRFVKAQIKLAVYDGYNLGLEMAGQIISSPKKEKANEN